MFTINTDSGDSQLNWRDAHDYAMSWDCYRALCIDHGEPDPGPLESPEPNPKISELEARVSKLEEERDVRLANRAIKIAQPKKFKGVEMPDATEDR